MKRPAIFIALACLLFVAVARLHSASVLVEAESFDDPGGWLVDPQFVDAMGSPYLLAHGSGKPVTDAVTSVTFPETGTYRLWVRTKDWTAPDPSHVGVFRASIGGVDLTNSFGAVGEGWLWQDGGLITITNLQTEIRLRDRTGFDARCDALFFSTDSDFLPPNDLTEMTSWRRQLLGVPVTPPEAGTFDLVVVGGGVAGTAAAIAAARQGLQVALIQDRPALGGNCSQDVRVHTMGDDLGGLVSEINTPDFLIGSDQFIQSDQVRMQVARRETNIHLYLEWRAFDANTDGSRITSVDAREVRTGRELRFWAPVFIDSTGDGWLGYWSGAQYRMGREARYEYNEPMAPTNSDSMTMGSTISWYSRVASQPATFPFVPWATNVSKGYYALRGDWYWEYGLNRDTIYDAEEIRDHLLKAIYGTFWTIKQQATNANRELGWVGHIAGKRESRRLIGDYVLTEHDVRNRPEFPDAVAYGTWSIDLHYTKPGPHDFITWADQRGVPGYWIPFRCLYSTNIDNLMMAGRCLSCTHVGLGSPRVMNTGGQMGVAAGTAAALCKRYDTNPRGVYQHHIPELHTLMALALPFATPSNVVTVIDNTDSNRVQITGVWSNSTSVSGYYGVNYIHDQNAGKGAKSVRFTPDLPLSENYMVFARWTTGPSRSTNAAIDIIHRDGTNTVTVNQQQYNGAWVLLGTFPFDLGNSGSVLIRNDSPGHVIADAVAFGTDFEIDPAFTGLPWQDDDSDGICNYVEWRNGTNPNDPLSFVNVRIAPHGEEVRLRFVAQAGRTYQLQYSDTPFFEAWREMTNVVASPVTREVEVADPVVFGTGFYRVVVPSQP